MSSDIYMKHCTFQIFVDQVCANVWIKGKDSGRKNEAIESCIQDFHNCDK